MRQGDGLVSPRIRRALIAIGFVSLVATVGSLLYGADLAEPSPTGYDSYSRGALGHHALVRTLEAQGYRVSRVRRGYPTSAGPEPASTGRGPLLFLEPRRKVAVVGGKKQELAKVISERIRRGEHVLVVLPKWVALSHATRTPQVVLEPFGLANEVLRLALETWMVAGQPKVLRSPPLAKGERVAAKGSLGAFDLELPSPQRLEGSSGDVLLGDEAGSFVTRFVSGQGSLTVVSDPDLFHNFNLHRAEHALVWTALFQARSGTGALRIDEVFHGHGFMRTLASALGRFPAVLLALAGLFAVLLVGWRGLVRLGPLAQASEAPGRGMREVIESSTLVLAVGQPLARLSYRYVVQVLDELAERFQLGGQSAKERALRLDQLAERRGVSAQAMELYRAVEDFNEYAPVRGGSALFHAARQAFAFQRALLSGKLKAVVKPLP